MKNKSSLVGIAVLAIVMVLLIAAAAMAASKPRLVLATTTSTQDSGLLDCILPDFEKKYNCIVDVIAVGSGQAMELGKNGDADVLLVHSPAAEKAFVTDGYGTARTLVMYNQFVIIGPEDDPAGVGQAANATEAFTKIYQNGAEGLTVFVSRGDNSGTHVKELGIWAKAGLDVTTFGEWYLDAGQGMGAVLDIAQEEMGYTLSDEATFYTREATGIIPDLDIVFAGDPLLFNQYSVIPVDPDRWPNVKFDLASDFVSWIISEETQALITGYKDPFGHSLFVPNPGPGALAPMTTTWTASLVAASAVRS